MADYYTNLSFELKLPVKALDWIESEVANMEQDETFEETYGSTTGCNFERIDPKMLWISNDESANVNALVALIQAALKRFKLKSKVGFEYSFMCSKPRLDAYGGGATVITKDSCDYVSTGMWLDKKMKAKK